MLARLSSFFADISRDMLFSLTNTIKLLGDAHRSNPVNEIQDSEFEKLKRFHIELLAYYRRVLGQEHIACVDQLIDLGDVHEKFCYPGAGLYYYEQALELLSKPGEASEKILHIRFKIAGCYLMLSRFQNAEELYDSVLSDQLNLFYPTGSIVSTMTGLLASLESQSKYSRAIEVVLEVLDCLEANSFPPNSELVVPLYRKLVFLCERTGDKPKRSFFKSVVDLLTILEVSEKALGRDSRYNRKDLIRLVTIYQFHRKNGGLAAYYRERIELLDLLEAASSKDSPAYNKRNLLRIAHLLERFEGKGSSCSHRWKLRAEGLTKE